MFDWFKFCLLGSIIFWGCSSENNYGPFEQVEEVAWNAVNKSHLGSDKIFVQATLRTFAYEIAQAYARAERENLGQEQLEYRLKKLIGSYLDGSYPLEDGTDLNSLYLQYLVFIDSNFDIDNPLEKQKFLVFRDEFIDRLLGTIFDPKYPMLRDYYDERWGITLFDRLVFVVYLNGEESESEPFIADLGEQTILVDQNGDRYFPSGTAGPYPYESDRPEGEKLIGKAYYRVFFPNRKGDNNRKPIINSETTSLELHIEGLGSEQVRKLRWNFPIDYPSVEERRLPSEAEIRAQKEIAKAEREALRSKMAENE